MVILEDAMDPKYSRQTKSTLKIMFVRKFLNSFSATTGLD